MTGESMEVRMARLEEVTVATRAEMRETRKDIAGYHKALGEKVEKHHDWLVALRRDRFWIFLLGSISASAIGGAVALAVSVKYGR